MAVIINTMQEDDLIHQRIKNIMLDVMAVLYDNGIKNVHMGAMMRLLGVDNSKAAEHDSKIIELDEKFGFMLSQLNNKAVPEEIPQGTTIH